MKRSLLLLLHGMSFFASHGQTLLYAEDFEASSPSFTLNTTDQGSAAVGANTWLINPVYAGGNGLAECLGFELPFTIPATAGQPAGINTPNGNYLHTASTAAVSSGVLNCSFGAADGFCTDPGNHFARMSADVSTVGQSTVTLTFWWLCQGGTGNYGEVYYSTDEGSTWNLITTPIAQYRSQSSWVQQTIQLPAFAEQSTLRFGFRFVNGTTLFGAEDPGFGIDEVHIIGGNSPVASILTGDPTDISYCVGAALQLPYTASGDFTAGNVFTAQLSDAVGNFTVPVVIGSVAAQTSGSVACTIPLSTPAGAGYRVRVVSSAPTSVGSMNGSAINLGVPPSAGNGGTVIYCPGEAPFSLVNVLGGSPDLCGMWTNPNNEPFSGVFIPGVDPSGTYMYTTSCPGPCPQAQASLLLVQENTPSAGLDVEASVCSVGAPFTPYAYINGGATTGQFFYQGLPFPLPDFTVEGSYALQYVVQGGSGCVNDTADFIFHVIAAANAGTGGSFTVCINDQAFDLGTLLSDAEPGGNWTDPSGLPFNGEMDPSTDISGIYTYTVQGVGPCGDALSFVAMVVDPCAGMVDLTAGASAIRWLGQHAMTHSFHTPSGGRVRDFVVVDARGRRIAVQMDEQQDSVSIFLGSLVGGAYTLLMRNSTGTAACRFVHVP